AGRGILSGMEAEGWRDERAGVNTCCWDAAMIMDLPSGGHLYSFKNLPIRIWFPSFFLKIFIIG
ncbi:TPA: hypothetical protein ACXJU9_005979, partial [Pseudomonas aeruginosa]